MSAETGYAARRRTHGQRPTKLRFYDLDVPPSAHQENHAEAHAASLRVCAGAHGADDARNLLAHLGLLPGANHGALAGGPTPGRAQ